MRLENTEQCIKQNIVESDDGKKHVQSDTDIEQNLRLGYNYLLDNEWRNMVINFMGSILHLVRSQQPSSSSYYTEHSLWY